MTKYLKIAIFASLLIKLFLGFSFDTADTGAMSLASNLYVQGQEVYGNEQVFLSSPPLHIHVLGMIRRISNSTHIPFILAWKLPAILADTALSFLLFAILVKEYKIGREKASKLILFYVLNPISLYVSGFHGQSEAVWIFFIIAAWDVLKNKKSLFFGAVLAAIATAYKLPAVLLIGPLLLIIPGNKRKMQFLLLFTIIFLSTLFPEVLHSRKDLVEQVFKYESAFGLWGISSIVSKIFQSQYVILWQPLLTKLLKLIIAILFIKIMYKNRAPRKSLLFFNISLQFITIFLILSPGFGIQYLFWPLPFLILTQNKYLHLYTAATTFGFLHSYGIDFAIFSKPINFLQKNIYYKTKMLYPYDLYYLSWLTLINIAKHKKLS